jgi:hypothetical protein
MENMRRATVMLITVALLCVSAFAFSQKQPKQPAQELPSLSGVVRVHGYTRKDGKYVAPHFRKRPSRHVHKTRTARVHKPKRFKLPGSHLKKTLP